MTIATSSAELPAGYHVDPVTGAWLSLPWPGDPLLPWNHPDRMTLLPTSLGPEVIRFGEANLVHHLTGLPWRYTIGQKLFLVLWYAVDDEGRWLYRSGVKRGAKGTGKDPFAAAWANTELCGPVRLVDIDNGRAVGDRHRLSLVQIAANSEAQASDVLRVANAMVPAEMSAEFGFDKGITRTQLHDGSRIELLTASEKSSEGDPATAIALNESHHMTESNGGHKVAEVARRNVGKSPIDVQARLIEFTNAHQQGLDSVAERSYEAWQSQVGNPKAKRRDILYDTREAPPDTDLVDDGSRMAGLVAAYSDSPWADLRRIEDEMLDRRTSVADSIRYYLNGLGAAEDAWVDPMRFDALADVSEVVADDEQVALFLDCSKSSDATGLMGCRISDGFNFTIDVWQKPHGDRGKGWMAPRHEVDAAVRTAFEQFHVTWLGVDPSPAKDDDDEALYWVTQIDAWHRDFRDDVAVWATPGAQGNSVLFDMRLSQRGAVERNKVFTETAMHVAATIDEDLSADAKTFRHDGNAWLRQHTHNAKRRPNKWGVSLGKVNRDSTRLVDLAVCMVGANLGRRVVLNSGKLPKKRGKTKAYFHAR